MAPPWLISLETLRMIPGFEVYDDARLSYVVWVMNDLDAAAGGTTEISPLMMALDTLDLPFMAAYDWLSGTRVWPIYINSDYARAPDNAYYGFRRSDDDKNLVIDIWRRQKR